MIKKIIVLATGTFDLVHKGHEEFLKQAKSLGDVLVVVIARDETVINVKSRPAMHDELQRKRDVEALGIADRVILGDKEDKFKVIEEVRPDIIALGYDQKAFTQRLKQECEKRNVAAKIVRLEAFMPEKYKSSLLKPHHQEK